MEIKVEIDKVQTDLLQSRYPDLKVLNYAGCNAPCTIQCAKCGNTWISTSWKNLYTRGSKSSCDVCCVKLKQPDSTRTSFKEINERIKSKYPDLEVLEYTKYKAPIKVRSTICYHEWEVSIAGNLLSKGNRSKCPECSGRVGLSGPPKGAGKLSLDEATELLLENNICAEVLNYSGYHNPAKLKFYPCEHIIEEQFSNVLYRKSACTKCESKGPLSLEVQADKLKERWPNLELVQYSAASAPCDIKHVDCGHTSSVSIYANAYAGGYKCKTCFPGSSVGEESLRQFITRIYSGEVQANNRLEISPYELDIYIPGQALALEYNGEYWHSQGIEKTPLLTKTQKCSDAGISLIHVFEHEWLNKPDIVRSRIRSKLGLCIKIHARKCEVRMIDFPKEFLEENHLQGAGAPSSVNLGLFLADELVSVMTFSVPRFTKEFDWELVRFASLLNVSVVGGASKLLKYFTSKFEGTIISYSDRRWSTGNLYSSLGFSLLRTTEPGYFWFKSTSNILSRYKTQKHKLRVLFPKIFSDQKTEREIMEEAGYCKVQDCGNLVWAYRTLKDKKV